MKIFVNDLKEDNTILPAKYTCDAEGISPEIRWQDVPGDTKSYALTCIDPDAPGGSFIHWLLCDIPKDINNIPEGGPVPEQARGIENDFGKTSYGGPCPPSGRHRYIFTIYALKVKRLDGVTTDNFIEMVEKYAIDKAALTALYRKTS